MNSRLLSVLTLSVLTACASETGTEVRPSTSSIVNGTPTDGTERAIVAVIDRVQGSLCTGTLIAPRVVLTAKHCVQHSDAAGPVAPSALSVGVGDSIRSFSATFGVAAVATTPGAYTATGGFISGYLQGVDVGVITLSTPVSGITPIAIHRADPSPLLGGTFRVVGYGQTPQGDVGRKYFAMANPVRVTPSLIESGATVCQGDSGGPMLWRNPQGGDEVVGVASFGSGGCGSGTNAHNRIDIFLEMIDRAVGETGACVNNGAEVCDGFDNDCDGESDEDCLPFGATCTAGNRCASRTCQGSICTTACDPLTPDAGCPTGFYCQLAEECGGFCAPGSAGIKGNGAACSADTECASLHCRNPGDGNRRCLEPCKGNAGQCIDGDVCAASFGSCGSCVPPELVSGTRGLGEPCADDSACATGSVCFSEEGISYCTNHCDAGTPCAAGYHCRSEGELCVRGAASDIGDACVRSGDCSAPRRCATEGEARWCAASCGLGRIDCPAGFSCVAAGDSEICKPNTSPLGVPCSDNAECLSSLCQDVDDSGIRVCSRPCDGASLCGAGFECRRNDSGTNNFCVRTEIPERTTASGCGCRTSTPSEWLSLVFFGMMLARLKRTRSASPRRDLL